MLLVLQGIRIRAAVRVLGYSKENRNFFILRFGSIELVDGKMEYTDKIPGEIRQKVHTYVRARLKENIAAQLNTVTTD